MYAGPDSTQQAATLLQQYAPIAQALVLPKDPRKAVEVLRAKIKNTKRTLRSAPFLSPVLKPKLERLKAQLRAAEKQLGLAEESETSTRVFRYLGWAAGGLAVLGIAGGTLWAVSKGRAASRRVT